jgi:hypothetical protein
MKGYAYTEETGFKQLVRCSMKVHLHVTGVLSPDTKKATFLHSVFKQILFIAWKKKLYAFRVFRIGAERDGSMELYFHAAWN